MSATGIMQLDVQLTKLRMDVELLKRDGIAAQANRGDAGHEGSLETEINALAHRVTLVEAKLDDLKSVQASAAKKERCITEAVVLQKVESLISAGAKAEVEKHVGPEFEAKLADSVRAKMDAVISERIEIAAQRVMNSTHASCVEEVEKLRREMESRVDADNGVRGLLEETPSLDPAPGPTPDADDIETVPQQAKRSRGRR